VLCAGYFGMTAPTRPPPVMSEELDRPPTETRLVLANTVYGGLSHGMDGGCFTASPHPEPQNSTRKGSRKGRRAGARICPGGQANPAGRTGSSLSNSGPLLGAERQPGVVRFGSGIVRWKAWPSTWSVIRRGQSAGMVSASTPNSASRLCHYPQARRGSRDRPGDDYPPMRSRTISASSTSTSAVDRRSLLVSSNFVESRPPTQTPAPMNGARMSASISDAPSSSTPVAR